MSLQPQSDVEFINTMFAQEGKKTFDVFKLKRLDRAVKALERNDPSQGAAARADYYIYTNQLELAFITLDKAIKQNGYNQMFGQTQVRAAKSIGRWPLLKQYSEKLLLRKEFKISKEDVLRYIEDSTMYLDNSGDFIKVLDFYDIKERDFIYSNIQSRIDWYLKQNGDLSVYQKVLELVVKTIKLKYSLPLDIEFRTKSLQLIISNKHWTLEETIELNKEINNAILDHDDIDFQIAADDIEVFCINIPISNIPEDFVYYEENDDDLIELVEARMASNLTPEVNGEELHV
ncbi:MULTISPECIES: hypothetical protein [unclassified Psychrobacter]|uniref:hypothetical protein n=1 Tax=unclassified Psychrobacter TaxID=196806 RepID=UPI000946D0DF|nr:MULTISPECIES: hypothetical protein [unclassified Psychrobacter]OLF40818.1 hypothetical protein BTV99_07290 [Psychrobacter sp. Rd 27.2]PJX25038.1 hypothetical protein CAP50_05660 [Psychrobacter sp. L7]